jgi:hypothetical protein
MGKSQPGNWWEALSILVCRPKTETKTRMRRQCLCKHKLQEYRNNPALKNERKERWDQLMRRKGGGGVG